MMRARFLTLTFLLASCCFRVHAQPSNDITLRPVVPPNPNAAALGKYGEVPVSLYTGVPNISVPIYEISTGRIKVPIALSYHAGGIRVEESASWVGLGWSLQAGGVITRTLRGRPDDDNATIPGGYFNYFDEMTVAKLIEGPNMPASVDSMKWYSNRQYQATERLVDAEPDLFTLNAPGLSCKFYYNQERKKFFTVPASKIDISFTGDAVSGLEWQVIDQNGLIYHFRSRETTHVSWDSRIESDLATSWFLSVIEDPLTGRSVAFSYTVPTSSSEYTNGVSEVSYFPMTAGTATPSTSLIAHSSMMKQLRLQKITFNEGEVVFTPQTGMRLDMSNDQALGEITVKNYLGNTIKRCEFKTSYFDGGAGYLPPQSNIPAPAYCRYRLKLDELWFNNADATDKNVYKFAYNETMVNRVSLDQDRWGYYNAAGNQHLVDAFDIPIGSQVVHLAGGDREVNRFRNQIGMLQRITYPTGGYSDFEYETNCWSSAAATGGSYQLVDESYSIHHPDNVEMVGGLAHSYTEQAFTVNASSNCSSDPLAAHCWGKVDIDPDPDPNFCPSQNMNISFRVQGTDPGNQNISYELSGPSFSYYLPAGNYKLILDITHCYEGYISLVGAVMHLHNCTYVVNSSPVVNHYVGGLRIKSIVSNDNITGVATKKTYDYSIGGDGLFSSGSVPSAMINNYEITKYDGDSPLNGPPMINKYFKRQSYSCIPLATTKGSNIGYSKVRETEWDGNTAKGFTNYQFTDPQQYPDISNPNNQLPFKPITSRDYMQGEILGKEVYAIKNGAPYLLKRVENEYINIMDTTQATSSYGFTGAMIAGYLGEIWEGVLPFNGNVDDGMQLGIYKEFMDIALLSKTTETTFDSEVPTKSIAVVTDYSYSPKNLQQNKTVTYVQSSGSEKKTTQIKYPLDYFAAGWGTVNATMAPLRALAGANIINQPVEVKSFVGGNIFSTDRVTASNFTAFNGTNLLPNTVYRLEDPYITAPATTISANQSGNLYLNPSMKPALEIMTYDPNGNILDQKLSGNITETYLWGYRNSSPVAKIVGSSYNALNELVNMSVLNNELGQYTEQQIRAELDLLRTRLPNAMVTTYTYKPLVGMTTMTDVNGKTVYYEYDSFNRLKLIRDKDGNILKTFDYKYQQNPNQ